MNITHIAIWTNDLERLRDFYCTYFQATSNKKYTNPVRKFESYILSFKNGGCSLELMYLPNLTNSVHQEAKNRTGLAHIAFSVGSNEAVDAMTRQFREAGYKVLSEPRLTGDGFYESVIADPDGNMVEITI